MQKTAPSMDAWLAEAKADESAPRCGMYLVHNGVVRETAKAKARHNESGTLPVRGMLFSYDAQKAEEAIRAARQMEGIHYVRAWLNEGRLSLGDDIMYVLIGGDIRPHVVDALQYLVGRLKNECVEEKELYE